MFVHPVEKLSKIIIILKSTIFHGGKNGTLKPIKYTNNVLKITGGWGKNGLWDDVSSRGSNSQSWRHLWMVP